MSATGDPIAKPLQAVEQFFASKSWKPFRFQRTVWRAYADGQSGLVHSATGTGKTLAVWMAPILSWLKHNRDRSLWDARRPPPLQVLWITPLRALAGDTENALLAPLQWLEMPWLLESRTGDSRASVKARQLKKLPTALITTPESLSLMLTHANLQEQLSGLQSVIVDEWHELLGTKRGIQTELALARLRRLNPALRIWGLSATLGNLQQASEALVGVAATRPPLLVQGAKQKRLHMESLLPPTIDRFPWSGHIGTRMVPEVARRLQSVTSALVFANTRSQTEIWYQQLLQARPDWAGSIALHHGSLDASVRTWVEKSLREGKLRAVVCTSSLDLGVDFSAVDLVVQIGSPKGAARLLQRAGRSGHQPGMASRLAFVPTNALELIELAAAQDSIREGRLESRALLPKPLDVLTQHVVTLALGGGFEAEQLLDELRSTQAYRELTDSEWNWTLDFVVRGGNSLNAYPEFHRVLIQDGRFFVSDRRLASRHRMNIGTIVSDASMQVKYLKGTSLGTAEESFLSRLKAGERFLFAGRLVELVRVRENVAYVRRSKGQPDTVPRWMGGRMPLSSELSEGLRLKLEQAASGQLIGREMKALRGLLDIQAQWSVLPLRDELLIERIKTRDGYQLFVFPFEGRLVHEGLAALVALRLSRIQKSTFSLACNDYGFVLQSAREHEIEKAIAAGVFAADQLTNDVLASINATEMAKRQFRQIARVSGLIQQGFPGQRKKVGHLQASSNMFFDVFSKYEPNNLLLEQSRQEVLEQQLEIARLTKTLERIAACRIVITEPPKVTPLAFGLLVDRLRERLSNESLAERVRRLQGQLEEAAG